MLIAGLLACASPAPQDDPLSAKLDAAMRDAITAREIPGAALVVVRDTGVVFSRSYGQADLSTGRPVTDSTPFVIGSTSKPLTALAVLRLVGDGRLDLDAPIQRYIPDVAWTDARAGRITLRHLLTNRSGMVVGFSGPAYARPYEQDAQALDRLARAAAAMPLLFAPGEGYAYSNRGWAVAGYVVQRVAGTSIEDVMQTEVFGPLGMEQSTLAFWAVPDLVQGYKEGYTVRNHPAPASVTRAYGPADMMVSTNRDVGRLLAALLAGGRAHDGGQALSADLVAEMFRPQADAESELGGPTRYGLGWEVDSSFGTLTIKKAGSVTTMVSLWVLLPETRTGIGFLFNREDYQVLPLVANVVRILSGLDAEPFPSGPAPSFTAPAPVTVSAGARAAWVGRYDTRFGDLGIFLRGDSLLARYEGLETSLVPRDDSSFVLVSDIVAHAGKVLSFRPRSGRVTVWLDADSIGVAEPAR
jgi:CubicO group peptidase (beta-lactamase class C family)